MSQKYSTSEFQVTNSASSVPEPPVVTPDGQIRALIESLAGFEFRLQPKGVTTAILRSGQDLDFPLYYSSRLTSTGRFRSLQKWEGTIVSVSKEKFLARLIDLTEDSIEEEAEFSIEEVEPSERDFVKAGAVFYWNIGYNDRPSGRQRTSLVRFRRLPSWSQEEISAAEAEAKRLMEDLGWS